MELTTARLVLAPLDPERDAEAPITVNIDVGTEFDATYDRAMTVGADITEPPVEQPWGIKEFALRLADGHQLVVIGPA